MISWYSQIICNTDYVLLIVLLKLSFICYKGRVESLQQTMNLSRKVCILHPTHKTNYFVKTLHIAQKLQLFKQ